MAKSSSEQHWSNISEAGSIIGMRLLLLCYRLFGRSVFRVFLFPVIGYFYLSNQRARLASKDYLARVSAWLPASQQASLKPFSHFWTFGELLLDKFLVWMGYINKQDIVFENEAAVQHMKRHPKGGIIVVSHLGNTEICSAIAHQLPNVKVTMLVYTQHAEKFNRMLKRTNADSNINMMQVTDISPATAMTLAEKIDAGEFIVIAGDRTPVQGHGRTSLAPFLGSEAYFPQGAFILANLLKCPVYLMFCLKHGSKYHIYMELFAELLTGPRKQREQLLDQAVNDYAQRLQTYCLMQPLQWFNFYQFWQHDAQANDEK